MKIILVILLSLTLCFGAEEEERNINQNGLDSFFQHILSKAFAIEFEHEKNITRENKEKISELENSFEELKNELKNILKESLSNNTLNPNGNLQNSDLATLSPMLEKITLEIESLKKEMKETKLNTQYINELESRINRLENRKVIPSNSGNLFTMVVAKPVIYIRENPYFESKNIGELEEGESVTIEYCDRYDWCKLKDRDGFVAKHLLIRR